MTATSNLQLSWWQVTNIWLSGEQITWSIGALRRGRYSLSLELYFHFTKTHSCPPLSNCEPEILTKNSCNLWIFHLLNTFASCMKLFYWLIQFLKSQLSPCSLWNVTCPLNSFVTNFLKTENNIWAFNKYEVNFWRRLFVNVSQQFIF